MAIDNKVVELNALSDLKDCLTSRNKREAIRTTLNVWIMEGRISNRTRRTLAVIEWYLRDKADRN